MTYVTKLMKLFACRCCKGVVLTVQRYHQSRVKRLEWQVDGCPRRMSEEEVRAAADEHGARCRRISITARIWEEWAEAAGP